jgi:hypothetical protein
MRHQGQWKVYYTWRDKMQQPLLILHRAQPWRRRWQEELHLSPRVWCFSGRKSKLEYVTDGDAAAQNTVGREGRIALPCPQWLVDRGASEYQDWFDSLKPRGSRDPLESATRSSPSWFVRVETKRWTELIRWNICKQWFLSVWGRKFHVLHMWLEIMPMKVVMAADL